MNCPRCASPMAVVEDRKIVRDWRFPSGEFMFVDHYPHIDRYRECTRCGQCAPMDETQPPYPEMRGPPQ